REAGPHSEGAENAGVEPGERTARPQDVGRGGYEVAPIRDDHAVFGECGLDGAAHRKGVHAGRRRYFRLADDLDLAGLIAGPQGREPGRPGRGPAHALAGERAQEPLGGAQETEGGSAVLREVARAAVGGDE